jgi:hypothetical protein
MESNKALTGNGIRFYYPLGSVCKTLCFPIYTAVISFVVRTEGNAIYSHSDFFVNVGSDTSGKGDLHTAL